MRDFIEKGLILRTAGRLDRDPTTWTPNHHLIGVQPDDVFPVRKDMQVRVFDMDHSVPCCGYGFYQCRQKLKREYADLSKTDLVALRRTNKDLQISEERMMPLFAFMGDTTTTIFEKYRTELSLFPVIIVECSFIDHEEHGERAADVKHVLWVRLDGDCSPSSITLLIQDDLQPFVLEHPEIVFVLIHFSQQYKSEQIKAFFQRLNLPNVIPFV